MKRRDFMKGALLASAVLATKDVSADKHGKDYDHHTGKRTFRLTNRKNPSVLEQKHVPAIDAPSAIGAGRWFGVKVRVGFKKEHPSVSDHWITKIKLLADGREIAKTEYEQGGVGASEATFRIRLNKTTTLEAIENCNLHGTWISDKIEVVVT